MRGELRFGKETRHRSWYWIPDALKLLFQIGIVCFLAFVFVWYFGQKTSNIGDSMNPVLKNGDVVLVDRFRYDASSPRRGDIIVFIPISNVSSGFRVKPYRLRMTPFTLMGKNWKKNIPPPKLLMKVWL